MEKNKYLDEKNIEYYELRKENNHTVDERNKYKKVDAERDEAIINWWNSGVEVVGIFSKKAVDTIIDNDIPLFSDINDANSDMIGEGIKQWQNYW